MAERIVRFDIYCKKCKYKDVQDDEDGIMGDPCNECLADGVNEDSRKPTRYVEDKK